MLHLLKHSKALVLMISRRPLDTSWFTIPSFIARVRYCEEVEINGSNTFNEAVTQGFCVTQFINTFFTICSRRRYYITQFPCTCFEYDRLSKIPE